MKKHHLKSDPSFLVNVAYNLLSLAGPLLFAFFATPLLVRGLGVQEYGYYSLVLAVIGFGFTTGIGRLSAKYVSEKRGAGRTDELPPLLAATILITLGVAALEAAILAIASPYLVSRILNVPDTAVHELQTAIYLACLIGPAMMLSQVFQSALQGIHRFGVFAAITIAASLLLNLGSVILAANSFPYSDIFVWNLIITATAAVLFIAFAKAAVPELRFTTNSDRTAVGKAARFAGSIFVYQSITSIFYLFERAYILRNYGPEALTYYTIPLMLGLYLHGLVLSFSQVAIPRFNERIANTPSLVAIYQTLTKLVVSVSTFLALMYFCVGGELLRLWLGPDFAALSFRLLIIDGFAFGAIALLIPSWILSESARRPGVNASSPLVTYLLGMFAIVILGSIYQTEGAAGGRLVGAIAAIPLIFVVERLVFGRILWPLWSAVVARVGVATVVVLLLKFFVLANIGSSWPEFLLVSLILSLAFWATLTLLGYLNRGELGSAFGPLSHNRQDSESIDAMP